MANETGITYVQDGQEPNVNLTIDMLKGMLDGIKECDLEIYGRSLIAKSEPDTDNVTESDIENDIIKLTYIIEALQPYAKRRDVAKAIKYHEHEVEYLKNRLSGMRNYKVPEHRAIMLPVQTNLEGIFATCEHLGEFKQPVLFNTKPRELRQPVSEGTVLGFDTLITNDEDYQTYIRGTQVFTVCGKRETIQSKVRTHGHGAGLSNLDKIIYYEAGMTAQGDAVLPHEDHSKRPWFKYAGGVKAKFGCTTLQAEELYTAFKILDTTPTMAKTFAAWIEKRGIEKAITYFRSLAIPLMCVTDIGESSIIDTAESYAEDHEASADNPADIADVRADAWHKLDDPRDFAPTWESRQPKTFRFQLARIRSAKTLDEVKAVGGSFFNDRDTRALVDSFTKTQKTVLWDEYHRAKNRLAPKLRPLALKALERLADKKVNLSKVAAWLHGEGKQRLNKHELSVVWDAWKKAKKAYAPQQTVMDIPEIPIEYYVE